MCKHISERNLFTTVQEAVASFLLDCKNQHLPIETLCDYENTLCDFFGGTGTEFIEDITQGSKIEYIGDLSLSDVREYKDRQTLQGVSMEALEGDLERLRRFLMYCRGYNSIQPRNDCTITE